MCNAKTHIEVKDLINNGVYVIGARNASIGIWQEKSCEFIISRYCSHTRDTYVFSEQHWDHVDKGTAKPFMYLARHFPKDDLSTLSYLEKLYCWQKNNIDKAFERNNYED
jgi:hypothetical protein